MSRLCVLVRCSAVTAWLLPYRQVHTLTKSRKRPIWFMFLFSSTLSNNTNTTMVAKGLKTIFKIARGPGASPSSVATLATFQDGSPALTKNTVGKGAAYVRFQLSLTFDLLPLLFVMGVGELRKHEISKGRSLCCRCAWPGRVQTEAVGWHAQARWDCATLRLPGQHVPGASTPPCDNKIQPV